MNKELNDINTASVLLGGLCFNTEDGLPPEGFWDNTIRVKETETPTYSKDNVIDISQELSSIYEEVVQLKKKEEDLQDKFKLLINNLMGNICFYNDEAYYISNYNTDGLKLEIEACKCVNNMITTVLHIDDSWVVYNRDYHIGASYKDITFTLNKRKK